VSQFSLRIVEEAHIGLRKKEQQDFHGHSFIPAIPEKNLPACCLVAVADGVSMGMAGALASQTAIKVLLSEFGRLYTGGDIEPGFALEKAFLAANLEIFKLAEDRPGMATTLAAGIIIGDQLITAHIGDTRIYLVRQNTPFKPVTIDHSWVVEFGQQQVAKGLLTEDQLKKHNMRHSITRALGLSEDLLVDFNTRTLSEGDLILICSDGLWDLGGEENINNLITKALPTVQQQSEQEAFNQMCHALVELAMNAGGRDNITVSLTVVDGIGAHIPMPGLAKLLERTAQDLDERVNHAGEFIDEPVEPTTLNAIPLLKGLPYKPMGVTGFPASPAEPQPERPQVNLDAMLARNQQAFALGQWDEAIEDMIHLEEQFPGNQNLFEMLSNMLLRYIGTHINDGSFQKAVNLYKKLEAKNLKRFDQSILDFCLAESRRASTENNYTLTLDYANFAAHLFQQDLRVRQLQELSQLYIEFERPGLPLNQRLSIAQKLYARDADFGAIQDDLSKVYMELGDEAVRQNNDDEALNWYSLISPLKPRDKRLISLANSKTRAIEDKKQRLIASGVYNAAITSVPIPGGLEKFSAANSTGPDGKPESEALSRLKERVSRAQNGWDNGRKEIGAEYIYLVDQLNQLLSPNPWQPTFPRVCYDYGKWLLEQKQYREAKPYLLKAQALGMAAATQRLNEIEKTERGSDSRFRNTTQDLPEPELLNSAANNSGEGSYKQPASDFSLDKYTVPAPAAQPTEPANYTYVPPQLNNNYNVAKPLTSKQEPPPKSEKLVGVSGELRNQVYFDPLQDAAMREARRSGKAGVPQTVKQVSNKPPDFQNPGRVTSYLSSIWLPGIIGLVIFVAVVLVTINIIGRIGQPASIDGTQIAATTITPAQTTQSSSTQPASGGVSVTINGVNSDLVKVWLAATGEPRTSWRELATRPSGGFALSNNNLVALDQKLKYTLVVIPRDTTTRKYKQDVELDAPVQTLFSRTNLSLSPAGSMEVALAIAPEALHFYPLAGENIDTTMPDGARYISNTRHIIRGDFLKFYESNGALGRFGFPISEEFDWGDVGRAQFFERGWLVQTPSDKLVKLGRLSEDILSLPSCENVPKPPPGVSTTKPLADALFTNFLRTNQSVGSPISAAFEISEGNNKKRVQYFQFARLEIITTGNASADRPVTLGLLGSEYSRCRNWYR
jgi:protein phosphatase